jgi:tRNA modification GTPase
LSNERQISKIKEAKASMEDVVKGIDLEMPVDLILVDLTNSYYSLADILGKSYETSINCITS